MAKLSEVWSHLTRVRALQFDSRTKAESGWAGVGSGTVTVSQPEAGVLVFEEAGTWQPSIPGRPAISFNNVFRWSVIDQVLRLEHLRFGPDVPVLLFDMAPGQNGEWREVSPHQCGEDCYSASLALEDGQLAVAWSIVGPQKSESIRYSYW